MPSSPAPDSIDAYIAAFPADVQSILQQIRRTIHQAAPEAVETISYRMPAFRLTGVLLYFAAFQRHIGVYPPVWGDPDLDAALSRYRGPKGNLQFPLSEPIPYGLIRRMTIRRLEEQREKAAAKRQPKPRKAP